jgi:outer membrane protein assembly factor BamD (BamD/ComL family)
VLTLLSTLALAQQEACEPRPAAHFAAAVDAATPLLSTAPSDAADALTTAAEIARCLAEPVDRDVLAAYAWARAEVAALDQDEEATWSWSTLAIDAGSPTPPERLPRRHPLRMVLADAPEAPPVTGPDDVTLAPPRKGSLYADGVQLTRPQVRLDTPHLIQIFDKDGLYLGFWQTGAAFPREFLLAKDRVVVKPTSDAHDAVPPPNWKPARTGTRDAYEAWLAKHPDGPWAQEARDAIDAIDWEAAKADGSELAYRQYIHDHPEGLHVRQAAFLVEHDAYTKVMDRPTRERWVEFLKRFDEGTYANEARLQIETIDWRAAQKADTPAAYRAFLEKHPKGRNVAQAEQREEDRTFEKAAAVLSEGGLKAYLERWPDGRFVNEAHALMGGVEITDAVLILDGDLPAPAAETVRTALLAELEDRKLPVAEQPSATTGRLVVDASTYEDGDFARVTADVALEYGALIRPLVTLSIDSQILKSADPGPILAEMLVSSLPPFSAWHHPPEEEGSAAKEKDGDAKPKEPLIVQ